MIGLGPHTMSAGGRIFLVVLQVSLVLLAGFGVSLAMHAMRPRSGR